MQKLIRVTTIPLSLNILLKGQLSYLNNYYSILAVSSSGKDLDEVRNREKVPTVAIEMERGINVYKDIKSFWHLYRCFKKEKPHIVHSNTPKAGLLSMAAAYFARVPIRIHTFTGLIFPSKKGFLKQLLINMDRLLCLFATNIYPEGQGVKKDLIKYGITKKPLRVLANGNINGIDTSHFHKDVIADKQKIQLRHELGIKKEDFVFAFVGRLVGDKGINELVAAFLQLNEFVQKKNGIAVPVKLLLVGPFESDLDPLKPDTKQEIRNNPSIISVGFQSDVRPYFAISKALVFPSYREGFPNVVMQAGAMGLASIVTNINGSNEIIKEGKNGLIIPVKNKIALYQAMKKIYLDKDFLLKLALNSPGIIEANFKREKVWRALLNEYKKLGRRIETDK